MSILYQALSRAARENARRNGSEAPAAAGGHDGTPEPVAGAAARLRNFTTLSFRPRRPQSGGRRGLYVLGGLAVFLAAGWLLVSSLSSGGPVAEIAAEIPIVSDVVDLLGLGPEPVFIEPPVEIALEPGDTTSEPIATTDDGAVTASDDVLAMAIPPAALTDSPPPEGGGIEFESQASTAPIVPAMNQDADSEILAETVMPEATLPDDHTGEVETAQADAPESLLPQDSPTDSMHPTDAPPEAARETLEETLERLANERGFTDLAPPVEISRAPSQDTTLPDQDEGSPDFSVTVDNRANVQQASFEAAYSSLLAGNTEAALNLYLDVLKDDPDNTFALFGLASTLQRIGWLAEARATYGELLAIEPDNRGALANMMTLISQEAPEQALSNLQRLYEINPGFSPIPAQMAVLFAGRGDYQEAIRYLRLAADLSPENLMYTYNLAIIHDRVGDYGQARKLYEEVLSAAEIRDVSIPLDVVRARVSYLKKL